MNETRSFPDAFPLNRLSTASAPSRADPQRLARRPDFSLGGTIVRPSVRTIEGPEGTATAEPLVMQVLLALVDANGAVVTREDLIRNCWRGHVVGDDSVNRTIAEIRRLARATGAGFSVQTIPRVGYRLDVAEVPVGSAPSPVSSDAPQNHTRRWVIGGSLAAAAGAVALPMLMNRPDPADGLIAEGRALALAGMPDTDRKALVLLEKAVERSPANAQAWGVLALTRARSDEHAITKITTPVDATMEAARRALALDPGNADAKAAMAMAIPYYGDWLAAERRFDSILREHPGHVFTHDSRSFLLGSVGRIRESAVARQRFIEQAPLDAGILFRQVYALWFLGRADEADRTATRGLEIWPRHPGLWHARLWVLAGTGRFDRATAHIDDQAGRPKLPPPVVATLRAAMAAAGQGDSAAISRVSSQVVAGVQKSVAGVVNAMMLLNMLGAIDAAFDVARAYYLEEGPIIAATNWRPGQPLVPDQRRRKTNMLFTPIARGMQRDARFLPLMERMGLAAYWQRRGITPDFLAER